MWCVLPAFVAGCFASKYMRVLYSRVRMEWRKKEPREILGVYPVGSYLRFVFAPDADGNYSELGIPTGALQDAMLRGATEFFHKCGLSYAEIRQIGRLEITINAIQIAVWEDNHAGGA